MRYIFLFTFIFSTMYMLGQRWDDSPLPEVLKLTFTKLYPEAKNIVWKKTPAKIYIVKYKIDEIHEDIARFDENGTWIETIMYIDEEDVPESIVDLTKKAHPDAFLINYQKILRADGDYIFLIEILTDKVSYEITYTKNGEVINVSTYEDEF